QRQVLPVRQGACELALPLDLDAPRPEEESRGRCHHEDDDQQDDAPGTPLASLLYSCLPQERRWGRAMDLGLRGKVAVVTAASGGLGRAIAEEFAAEGAITVIAARNEARLTAAAKEIADKTQGTVVPYRA